MLGRVFDRVLVASACVGAFITVFLWLSINLEVFMRYVLNSPTKWVVDFAGFFVIAITFLGAAWLLSKDGHVKIELVLNMLPPKVQRILNIITSVLGGICCGVLLWYSVQMTLVAFQESHYFYQVIIIPRWPVYALIPFGSLLLTVQFLRRGWRYARHGKLPENLPEESITPI